MQTKSWSPVLAALTEPELSRLLAASTTHELHRGAYLALAGEPPTWVHLVESGLAKLMAADPRGWEVVVGLVTEGDLVGALAALEEDAQDVDALAVTPVEVTSIEAATFTDVVTRSPRALAELARIAARRNRTMTRIMLDKAAAPVPERLAGSLLDLAEVLGTRKGGTIEMDLPFSQADLGSLAGMCRETACKTMRRFRARGIVDYRGRRLRILQPDLLEYLRCGRHRGGPRSLAANR